MTPARQPKSQPQPGPGPDPREFARIPAHRFVVDQRIQREVNPETVAKIANEFDWNRFEALTSAANDDGTYNVVEGQHRTLAAQALDPNLELPTMVVPDIEGIRAQAQTALDIVKGRHRHSAYEQWRQRYNAGHDHEVFATVVLEKYGLRVGKSPAAMTIGAVATIRTIVHGGAYTAELGAEMLDKVLCVLMTAFPTYDHESNVNRWNRNLLLAVHEVVAKNPDVNLDRLAAGVRVRPAIQWVNVARDAEQQPAHLAIANAIKAGYNRGLRKGKLS